MHASTSPAVHPTGRCRPPRIYYAIPRWPAPSRAAMLTTAIILFLLVAMPKGGIKFERIPITFSYLALGLAAVPCLAASVRTSTWNRPTVVCILMTIPLSVMTILKVTRWGYYEQGFALALITNVCVLPFVFLVCFRALGPALVHRRTQRLLLLCIALVTLFGLVEFVSRNFFGSAIEVPYITVNSDDVGRIWEKHNQRTNLVKLVSTYNNGNIFGICMLILGPLFWALKPARALRLIYLAALFLTLSRTVWAGMLIWLVLWEPIFRRRPVSMLLRSPIHLLTAVTLGGAGIFVLSTGTGFLFDQNLGGRLQALPDVEFTLFGPDMPFLGIGELTYTSFLQNFGLAGLMAFAGWLCAPVIACLTAEGLNALGPLRRAALISLTVYMVVCAVDGAFMLIPVIALYWLVASYLLNPACERQGGYTLELAKL
ncbi:hypothetical protein [Paludibaculum fermentans]|uniref:Uncharacterized protein n=1 Tax=Paludibaculum fermentans TaxID=1473598 RepID=A0A7S7NP19_PALFE|nr:hypothetical protein [Paludibaculum fermentans]QOY87090.1 hypothetical protein IRI77_30635 [Paludibaculum fermentans]